MYRGNNAVNLLLPVASFVRHFVCETHPCCLQQHFFPFNCYIVWHRMQIPNLFIHFITDGHLNCLQISASLNTSSMHEYPYKFLLVKVHMHCCWVYTQEWNSGLPPYSLLGLLQQPGPSLPCSIPACSPHAVGTCGKPSSVSLKGSLNCATQ